MPLAPAANALVTVAEYVAAIGAIDDADTDKYQLLINQASARCELYKRRALKARDYSGASALILHGSGRPALVVPVFPINYVAHLYLDGSRAFGVDTEIAATAYYIHSSAGLLELLDGATFTEGRGNVKAELNAGYASTTPEWATLQNACIELVRWMASRYAGFIGKRTETNADGMSIGYEIELPMNVRSLLDSVGGDA
jgi:hypothetical protein